MEQLEKQDRTIRKLKKQLKVYSKRIGEMGGTGENISQQRLENLYICVFEGYSISLTVMSHVSLSRSNRGPDVTWTDGGRADSPRQHSPQRERFPRDAGVQEGG